MSDDLFTGYGKKGEGSINIGKLPGRKSYCLYEVRHHNPGASIHTLAFFKSEADARAAIRWLDFLAGSIPVDTEVAA